MEVDISGAKVFFTIPIDFPLFGKIQISETLVVSWIVMALITGLCIWLTRDLKVRNISKRQAVAEMIVETAVLRADTTPICSDALRQMPKEKRSVWFRSAKRQWSMQNPGSWTF